MKQYTRHPLGSKVRLIQSEENIDYWNKRGFVYYDYKKTYIVARHHQANGCINLEGIHDAIGSWRFERVEELPEDLFNI